MTPRNLLSLLVLCCSAFGCSGSSTTGDGGMGTPDVTVLTNSFWRIGVDEFRPTSVRCRGTGTAFTELTATRSIAPVSSVTIRVAPVPAGAMPASPAQYIVEDADTPSVYPNGTATVTYTTSGMTRTARATRGQVEVRATADSKPRVTFANVNILNDARESSTMLLDVECVTTE